MVMVGEGGVGRGGFLLLKPQRGGTIMFFQTAESCNLFEKWELYARHKSRQAHPSPPLPLPLLIPTAVCSRPARIGPGGRQWKNCLKEHPTAISS